MRKFKEWFALLGLVILLQACGGGGATLTPSLSLTETIVVEPTATAPINAATPFTEFFSPVPFRTGLGFRTPWLELYFIDPTNPFAQREVGGIDAIVSAAILTAGQSVDVAMRYLSMESIIDALITASRRGVTVRVVTESDNLTDSSHFQVLADSGIPIIGDQQPGLMNASFIVIDHNQVWTGSADYDSSGIYKKYNAIVRLLSEEIAANYTKEFNEMFVNQQFGRLIVPENPYPNVDIQGTQVEVLFSPDDFVVARLSQLLGEAQESIYFLAYSFASPDLGTIIRDRAAQGVKVSGVLEFDRVDPNRVDPNPDLLKELNLFRQAGLDVRLDGGPEVMYHKILIIDGRVVVVGSYDFTERSENENDENVLILHSEMIAQKFMEEFQRVQSRAQQ